MSYVSLVFRNLLLAAGVFLFIVGSVYAQNSSTTTMIKESEIPGGPLRIVGYQVSGEKTLLKNITIEVKNNSSKPVYFFRYAMILSLPVSAAVPLGYQFIYNDAFQKEAELDRGDLTQSTASPLLPGATVKLAMPDNIYNSLIKFIASEYSLQESDIKQIRFVLQNVYYGDGTGWFGGADYSSTQSSTTVEKKGKTLFRENLVSQLDRVNAKSPTTAPFFAGCSSCAGGCGTYTLVQYCLRYASSCHDYVTDFQYVLTGNGSVRPTPMQQPCPNGSSVYGICVVDTCQQQ